MGATRRFREENRFERLILQFRRVMNFRTAALPGIAAVFCVLISAVVPVRGEEPAPITLVFYNLKNYLAMDRRVDGEIVEGAPKPEREVEEVVEAILAMEPDILSVCEIGDATFLEDLQSRLKAGGLDLPHTDLVTAASGHNRNLAVLSRFPIAASDSRDDYTYSIGDQRLPFQRGV